jgi:hypothetical protein
MKGIICACLLASLQSLTVARAYEADIHYSTTYVLARAVGWSEADALTIASANQGLDENQDTVAALEVRSTSSHALAGYVTTSLHQADKNLQFHCFSKTPGHLDQVSADVLEVIADRFAEIPRRGESPHGKTRRLIALGAALHCQQDAYSHVGFGGSCGSHLGSCLGHTYETFLDQVVFGLMKKHYFNPDHPGVSGEHLLEALQGTVRELAARRPKGAARSIPAARLLALSDALRGSGLELADDLRRDCNRFIAGKWLHDFFVSRGRPPIGADGVERLAPGIAATCRNESLAAATVVRIPDPRFPRLNPDASPHLVSADGSYELLRDGAVGVALPAIHAERTASVRFHLSHWSHLLALPRLARMALLPADRTTR